RRPRYFCATNILWRLRGELSGSGGGHPALPRSGETAGRTSPQGLRRERRRPRVGPPLLPYGMRRSRRPGGRTRRDPIVAVTPRIGGDGPTVHTLGGDVTFRLRRVVDQLIAAGQRMY